MRNFLNWLFNIVFLAIEIIACLACVFMVYICLTLFSVAVLFKVIWIPILGIIGFTASFSCNLIATYNIMKGRLDNEDKE